MGLVVPMLTLKTNSQDPWPMEVSKAMIYETITTHQTNIVSSHERVGNTQQRAMLKHYDGIHEPEAA